MPVLVLIAGLVLLSAAIAFSLVRIGRAQIGPGFPVGVVGVVGGALVTDMSRFMLPGHPWVPLAGSAVGAVGWALVIISVHPNWRQVLCDALVVGPSLLLLGVCATVLVGDVPLNPQLDLDLLNLGATLFGSSLLTRIALSSPVASRLDRPLLAAAGVLRVAAWAAIAATSAELGAVPDSVIAVMMGLSYVLAPAVLVHMGLRSVQQVRLAPHPLTGRPAAMVTIVASCMALATIGVRHEEAGRPALLILSGVTAVTLVLMQMITLGELEAAGTAAARRETFYTALLGATADAIITCDIHGRITYASPVAPRVLGVDTDPTGRVLWELLDTPAVDIEMAAGGGVLVEAHVGRRVLEAGVALHGDRLVVSVRDVTERDDLRWRLHRLAYEDPLTGLANRARLVQVVDDMIAAPDGRLRTAVLFVDLDRFKQINDASGHAVGDQVLVQVAHRLGELATDGFLARLGGDEFVIATTADHADVETLADRIIDVLGQPFEVDGGLYHIGASTGIAHATDEATADELLRRADLAMYRAKHNREGWARYEHAMAEAAVARVDTDNEVGAAIAEDRVLMFLQPVIDTDSHAVVACEALARWVGRDGSVRSPAPLLEFAQRTGQLGTLTAWMLDQAVRRLSTAPTGHTMIAVNMPPTLLADPALVDGIMSLLDAHRVDPRRLELEITEEAMVEQGPRVLRVISALRADGIRMVVDDFGSGYSSMAYLSRFPIDGVKIDRTFTTQLTDSEASRSVVRGLMGIATEMGMTVVAEGVETPDQLAWLRELAVPRLQGFLFARPQDASSVADITRLDSWRRASGELGSRAA